MAPPFEIAQQSYKRHLVIRNWMVRTVLYSSAKTSVLLLRLQSTSFLFCSASLTSSLLIPLKYCSCLIILHAFFIFCYKTERKAITAAEYGLDQQKNNSGSFRTESNLWKKKDAWKLYSGKRSISVMKQIKCAEQRKGNKVQDTMCAVFVFVTRAGAMCL